MKKFGIEIECFSKKISREGLAEELLRVGIPTVVANRTTQSNQWKIVRDGSIYAPSSDYFAMEVVSPPLKGSDGIRQIEAVCQVLEQFEFQVNTTCGFHVHIEVGSLRTEDLVRLYKFYGHFEASVIDNLMPRSRRGSTNYYCQSIRCFPWKFDCVTTWKSLSQVFHRSRYLKVNIEAYGRHGTVEFRQHSGTVEAEKIINWMQIVQAMVRVSTNRDLDPDQDSLRAFINELQPFLQPETIQYIVDRYNYFTQGEGRYEVCA